MAVLRKNKVDNYTVIDNSVFRNKELSLKAKGLLCQMLSLPDGWKYSLNGLTALSDDGITVIRSALNELENQGYFKRHRLYENGKLAGVEYIISETPMSENLILENLKQENLILEKQPLLNTNNIKDNNKSNTKVKESMEKKADICKDIINEYNVICHRLIKAERLTESRKKHIKARVNEMSREEITVAFHKANESDFLCGLNDRGWKADFDWLMKNSDNISKVLEGKYDNQKKYSKTDQELIQAYRNIQERSYDDNDKFGFSI